MKRFVSIASAVSMAAALAVPASAALAAPGDRSAQGGIANPGSTPLTAANINSSQQRISREVRRLRSEVRASLKRNGGVIPEPERSELQARLDALKAEAERN